MTSFANPLRSLAASFSGTPRARPHSIAFRATRERSALDSNGRETTFGDFRRFAKENRRNHRRLPSRSQFAPRNEPKRMNPFGDFAAYMSPLTRPLSAGIGRYDMPGDCLRELPLSELEPVFAGLSAMELAGLEPATSWVRSSREPSPLVATGRRDRLLRRFWRVGFAI